MHFFSLPVLNPPSSIFDYIFGVGNSLKFLPAQRPNLKVKQVGVLVVSFSDILLILMRFSIVLFIALHQLQEDKYL